MELEVEGRKIGESKVSQRGSVVIPKAVREVLDVSKGDKVVWRLILTKIGTITVDVTKKKEVQNE